MNFLKQFVLFLAILCLVFSCKKNDSAVGLDVIPGNDFLFANYSDTSSMLAYSLFEDTLRSDEATDYCQLGSYMDPTFGRTDASIYCNFVMPNNIVNAGFGGPATLDSVVFVMAYYQGYPNYYGDINDALKVNVYQLTQQMYRDSNYYTSRRLAYTNTDITYSGSGQTYLPKVADSVMVDTVKQKAQLRIRLKDSFGQAVMSDTGGYLASTAALQSKLKGFFITTQGSITLSPEYGSLAYMRMVDALTQITFYYKNVADPLTAKKLSIPVSSSAARYNAIDHDYQFLSTPSLSSQLYNVALDTTTNPYGNQNLFLQGLAGTRLIVKFPFLTNYADTSPVTINKAELIFKVDKNAVFAGNASYFVPPRLNLYGIGADNKPTYILDQFGLESTSFGGNYDPINGEYKFNIARTISSLANKTSFVKGFYVVVYQSQINPARAVLGGFKNTTYQSKLKIWYTKLHKN